MWKIIVAFIVFAALGIWLLTRGGEVDLGGEKHEVQTTPHATDKEAPKKP